MKNQTLQWKRYEHMQRHAKVCPEKGTDSANIGLRQIPSTRFKRKEVKRIQIQTKTRGQKIQLQLQYSEKHKKVKKCARRDNLRERVDELASEAAQRNYIKEQIVTSSQ